MMIKVSDDITRMPLDKPMTPDRMIFTNRDQIF